MRNFDFSSNQARSDPLDVIEHVVSANDWMFDRCSDQEMAVQAPGRWCDYSLYFAWNEEMGAMHFTCAFEMRIAAERRHCVHELLALINERLWLGHFTIWHDEGLPMFRAALPLRGTHGPSIEQMEDLMDAAIGECERFFPAFQYVIWGGRSAADAIAEAMIDVQGEA